jgi:hypothetical protein
VKLVIQGNGRGALQRVARKIGDLGRMRREVSKGLDQELEQSYREQFSRGVRSDGGAFPVSKIGTRMVRSGRLAASGRARLTMGGGGAIAQGRLTVTASYAEFQRGPRRVLPTSNADVGWWRPGIEERAQRGLGEWTRRALS